MPDVISQLHKDTDGRLLDSVSTGKDTWMSIQASKGHLCHPKKDNLPPYMYDSFEVLPSNELPPQIAHEFKQWWGGYFYEHLPKEELQKMYDQLVMYYNYDFRYINFMEMTQNHTYEEKVIKQCVLTHDISGTPWLQRHMIHKMLLMMYGVR